MSEISLRLYGDVLRCEISNIAHVGHSKSLKEFIAWLLEASERDGTSNALIEWEEFWILFEVFFSGNIENDSSKTSANKNVFCASISRISTSIKRHFYENADELLSLFLTLSLCYVAVFALLFGLQTIELDGDGEPILTVRTRFDRNHDRAFAGFTPGASAFTGILRLGLLLFCPFILALVLFAKTVETAVSTRMRKKLSHYRKFREG